VSADENMPEAAANRPVDLLRRLLAQKAAEIIRSDPAEAATALELGIIDQRWLEDPGNRPISTSKPTEILEQFLARSVERKPSLLSTIGLSAVQVVTTRGNRGGGETRTVTVMFTDLEGFTSFTDAHGDDAAVDLIDRHHRAAGPVVRRGRGRVVKHLGDGLLCTFPDAGGGVRAALELMATPPSPLRIRAGLHVGDAVVSRGDVVGHVVNTAARIAETAKGAQVVVSGETVEAAGAVPGVEFRRLRKRRLKGIAERLELFEALALPASPSR
jgi:adenylate cyclase